ncbi:MAG: AAA family ATPase [Verrucomicrobiales bacterium]|nr:AAA family ATPase [Verrucomicrobiales bacterium]
MPTIMLKTLTIQNFKRFKQRTKIDFEAITILLGANNSGKSTVLQALSIFQYCLDNTRKKKNGALVLDTKTIGPDEFGALPVASPKDLWSNGQSSKPIEIEAEFDNGSKIKFEIKFQYNRFSIHPTVTGPVSQLVETTKIRYVPIHSGLGLREEYRLAPAIADSLQRLEHGSVIRNLLWDLKENDVDGWKRLLGILKRLYPEARIDVNFDKDVDRFIGSGYSDKVLERNLDVVVSGTGFQQVLQIFTGVLSQGSNIVLLDEPDAHLHGRLQSDLMKVFEELAIDPGIQFVMASHSPHLLAAAPSGSLRAMIEGRAHAFAQTPEQMDVLDSLGAFDRMEIVPLLRTKAVVFTENRDDRDYLKMFAVKHWGEEKTARVWEGLSFLFTYQEPISADVKRLARQVKDLLNAPSLGDLAVGQQARFVVVGDRDYRSEASSEAARNDLESKAKSDDFKLDLVCSIWKRNEIENYLLDPSALEEAVVSTLRDSSLEQKARDVVKASLSKNLVSLKEDARLRIAGKLQHENHEFRGDYVKTTKEASRILDEEWGDGLALCDAKKLLSGIRADLQSARIPARLNEADVVKQMSEVPKDVRIVLQRLQQLATPTQAVRPRRRRMAKVAAPKKGVTGATKKAPLKAPRKRF